MHAISSKARHDFDAEHNRIENESDPQDTAPQRIIIRLDVLDRTAAIFPIRSTLVSIDLYTFSRYKVKRSRKPMRIGELARAAGVKAKPSVTMNARAFSRPRPAHRPTIATTVPSTPGD